MRYPDVREYPKMPNYYGEMLRPAQLPQIRDNWMANGQGNFNAHKQ